MWAHIFFVCQMYSTDKEVELICFVSGVCVSNCIDMICIGLSLCMYSLYVSPLFVGELLTLQWVDNVLYLLTPRV